MIDINVLRERPDYLKNGIRLKRHGEESNVDALVKADSRRRALVTEVQNLQEKANAAAKSIGQLMKEGRRDEAQGQIKANAELKEALKGREEEVRTLDEEVRRLLLEIPNPPHESVPEGAGPADNAIPFQVQVLPGFDFTPRPHWELAEEHGLVDFDRGAKVTGAGFPFYLG
ncbi:MAG: serine--tRNA ligase, partial [Rhodothermales bacterium]|nr:serine--tRNA ligase [Rhodothermales bacterium]